MNCTTSADCPRALIDYAGWGISGCDGRCAGGSNIGKFCYSNAECPGARCNFLNRKCNGGLENGQLCTFPADCEAAKCANWSCDTTNHWCSAQHGIPYCTTLADCNAAPYNKYCALDPNWRIPWTADAAGNGVGCTFQNNGLDSCQDAVLGYGPCVMYTTCTATHQCLGSTMPCSGGTTGAGSVCNNVCRSGQCSSDFVSCP
jgi:hypothetical protein